MARRSCNCDALARLTRRPLRMAHSTRYRAVQPCRGATENCTSPRGRQMGSTFWPNSNYPHSQAAVRRFRRPRRKRAFLPGAGACHRVSGCRFQDYAFSGRSRHCRRALRSNPDRRRSAARSSGRHVPSACHSSGPQIRERRRAWHPRHRRTPENHSSSPAEDIRTFLDSVAYNWLVAGTDAHAKNYSLLIGAGALSASHPSTMWPAFFPIPTSTSIAPDCQ